MRLVALLFSVFLSAVVAASPQIPPNLAIDPLSRSHCVNVTTGDYVEQRADAPLIALEILTSHRNHISGQSLAGRGHRGVWNAHRDYISVVVGPKGQLEVIAVDASGAVLRFTPPARWSFEEEPRTWELCPQLSDHCNATVGEISGCTDPANTTLTFQNNTFIVYFF